MPEQVIPTLVIPGKDFLQASPAPGRPYGNEHGRDSHLLHYAINLSLSLSNSISNNSNDDDNSNNNYSIVTN